MYMYVYTFTLFDLFESRLIKYFSADHYIDFSPFHRDMEYTDYFLKHSAMVQYYIKSVCYITANWKEKNKHMSLFWDKFVMLLSRVWI